MKKIILLLFIVTLFFIVAPSAYGANASLYLSPPSGTYVVASTFSVTVKVNSGGEGINAAEGILIFNPTQISVVKLSKTNSIFSLWTTEPTFSNSVGNIIFGGGTPTAFSGTSGTIITINFRAKASASAQVSFSSGSVLKADGKGTNILGNMNGGVYNLKSKIITPPAEGVPTEEEYLPPSTPTKTPAAPVISSPTHPDENKWYSNNNPEFSWKSPPDVTGVSLLLHKNLTGNPGPISDGLVESKKYEDVKDGIWYFHIKFENQYGWGEILHRKVLIDTESPKHFEITVDDKGDPTNPTPVLHFNTTDSLSGIEYYEVGVDEEHFASLSVEDIKTNPYQMLSQSPGKHAIKVTAFDKAENFTQATAEIEISPIETPTITRFPKTLTVGQNLVLEGESLPEVKIKVFIQKEGEKPKESETKADEKGKWSFISKETLGESEEGEYQVWVQAQDERGALSLPSRKISFLVGLPSFLKFGKIAISYFIIMIALIVLIIGVVAIIFYVWYRISLWRKRLRKETKEVAQSVSKAFRALREEVQEQIEYLDKKPGLSKSEKAIRDKLQEALDVSEEFISKEIKDIEKELE